ncbi:universal stress protein [Nakamurella sp. GG22]
MTAANTGVVIAGVDGSRAARYAAHWAATDAVRRGVPLRLVHALAHPEPASYPAPVLVQPPVTEKMRKWARHMLSATASELTDEHPELVVQTAAHDGTPWAVLVGESEGAILTVVGSHGGGRLADAIFGSVASRLASHGHGCVVIVHPPAPGGQKSRRSDSDEPPDPTVRPHPATTGPVVVGIDGSPEADAAVSFAFLEARIRSTPLVAIHTWNDNPLEHAFGHYPLAIDADVVHGEECRRLADHLARWVRRYPDVQLEQRVLRGRPAATLLSYLAAAPDGAPQLLIVGNRGRGGFASMLLGSTSMAMVAHADCPVAVVRGPQVASDSV